ncbi:hypothetical protein [Rhodoligotrophos defluvii]|uniref:hypothetical protein n=1 Tax=Rhodoligotrophos defluvii TaxID=2561934 RepID=UPI0010C9DA43|nr:hypothetical protein [Rhodoligotrophos defluvii]
MREDDTTLPIIIDILAPTLGGRGQPAQHSVYGETRGKLEIKRVTIKNVKLSAVSVANLEDCFRLRVGRRTAYVPHLLDARNYSFLAEQSGSNVVVHLYRNRHTRHGLGPDQDRDLDTLVDA